MQAKVKAVYPKYVTMSILQNGREISEYHIDYKDIRITDVVVGQVFDVVEDKFGGLTFWREGQ